MRVIELWLCLVAVTFGLLFAVGLIRARGWVAVFVMLFVRVLNRLGTCAACHCTALVGAAPLCQSRRCQH